MEYEWNMNEIWMEYEWNRWYIGIMDVIWLVVFLEHDWIIFPEILGME